MAALTLLFNDGQSGRINFREMCVSPLGRSEKRKYGSLYATALDMGINPESDVLRYVVAIWDKTTDRFSLCLPQDEKHMVHRTRVHFFHEGFPSIKDSGAFLPAAELLTHLPELGRKGLVTSRSGRVVEDLTHAQLEAILMGISKLNQNAKAVFDLNAAARREVGLVIDNTFANRSGNVPQNNI